MPNDQNIHTEAKDTNPVVKSPLAHLLPRSNWTLTAALSLVSCVGQN